MLDSYEQAIREPRAPGAVLAADVGSPTDLALRASNHSLDDLALPDDVYRAFLALSTRPRLRRDLLRDAEVRPSRRLLRPPRAPPPAGPIPA